jgi:enoyl-CoA hydratase/carnithine racemase
MMSDGVKRELQDGVLWVTIDRPEARNALSGEVLDGLDQAVEQARDDESVRVVVVTGAGDKAFCAGADLKERIGMSEDETFARINLINHVFNGWSRIPRPTIAAMNGVAFGGGLELALVCDFRIAVETAEMGLTEVRLGIMPGAGGTQRLPRLIGIARAKELILLGRRISAKRAHEIGLVTDLVPAGQLDAAVRKLLGELRGCAPISLQCAKDAIDRGCDGPIERGLEIERACYDVTLPTEDRIEGLTAFAEKRPPRYQGR